MNYRIINLVSGWLVFLIATIVYFITLEDTVSLWDCGEYITAAYKLEVGHPPGAPLFMVLGRLFSFFADPENVAVWINRLSALSSSMTILFMFWSISMLAKKMVLKVRSEISTGDMIAIFGSAAIGSLAYAFSDSFWFSAVEGEVYAMSSLFTAVIFWAILKWDEEMYSIQHGLIAKGYSADRWLLLIMFLLGLAIGVHLLGILVVPAITYMIYFRYAKKVNPGYFILIGMLGIFVLGFIQEAVIPGSISMASSFEVAFVNSFGLPFYTGTVFFFLLLVLVCFLLLRIARKRNKRILYSAMMGLTLLLIGYGSFAVIVIRSNANTPLDENDPENLVTLHAYLKREQYGSAPLLFGQYWNSELNDYEDFDDLSPFHLRRFVVMKGDQEVKAFKDENRAVEYSKKISGSEVQEKYYESNAKSREGAVPTYAQTTFFPRMYWGQEAHRVEGYKKWSEYDPNDDTETEKGSDGNRLPTFSENIRYFKQYQINWMYWRYFMWNFAGRQNDIQGHGDAMRGNWLSGFEGVDKMRLGEQGDNSPYFTNENPSYNKFFFLPLILGFIGLLFHYYRTPKDAFVLTLAFLFTGLAIVIYLNQKPFEPRERDYAYAASFYFFAFWIGIGAFALYEFFRGLGKGELPKFMVRSAIVLSVLIVGHAILGLNSASLLGWLIVLMISAGAIAVMAVLGIVLKKDTAGAGLSFLLCLAVPLIMGVQGWDDHDRSDKTTAHDLALNYLKSCGKNGIIFTNGDNDTFPLWYMQEVEGKRTDVRVCNLSLMQTDWYTEQMKMKAYESEPLPIKFTEDQILMYAGNTDQVLFSDLFELCYINAKPEIIKEIIRLRVKANKKEATAALAQLSSGTYNALSGVTGASPKVNGRLSVIKQQMSTMDTVSVENDIYNKFRMCLEVLSAVQGGTVKMDPAGAQKFQEMVVNIEKSWNTTYLPEAMEFVRNDDNLVTYQGQRLIRVFPSAGFKMPINVKNAIDSGVLKKEDKDNCLKELRFTFDKRGITREQVMMLDIIANNDWKRGLYFSSPGGSDVSMALYRAGHIRQNGMAFEVSPLDGKGRERFNMEEMYNNLMTVYSFGEMNKEGVLTDYYARRHTNQYRQHFLTLAEEYLAKALRAEAEYERYDQMLANMPEGAEPPVGFNPSLPKSEIPTYKTKAANLLNRSIEIMPANMVLDWAEPTKQRDPNENYKLNGVTIPAYTDGALHEYVGALYMSGDKKSAEALGMEVARQLETVIDYFYKTDVEIAANRQNTKDLYAACDAYFRLHMAAADAEFGNPNGELAKQTRGKIEFMYDTMWPSMMDALKEKANANGESVRRGTNAGVFARMMFDIQDYSQAMGVHFGMIDPAAAQPAPQTNKPGNQPLPTPGNGGGALGL